MKKSSKKLIGILIVILLACIYYYVTIPAINIHSSEFWIFIILLISGGQFPMPAPVFSSL